MLYIKFILMFILRYKKYICLFITQIFIGKNINDNVSKNPEQ